VKSHNYGRDFVTLQKLLPLNLRYVGVIGPRKRPDQIINELLDIGVTINAGFFAPAGLDIGAETSEEIALLIVAEILRVFEKSSGESLREREISIHPQQNRDPTLEARDVKTGNLLWDYQTEKSKENKGWTLTSDRRANEPRSFYSNWYENWVVAVNREFGIGLIFSSPLIANGTVYFGSSDGFLYALE
jgi:XdhC Rossmann domain/PQQ-like domain